MFALFAAAAFWAQQASSPLVSLLPFALIGVFFYLLVIKPQRKDQARRQEMLRNVKKNDRVISTGGIYGVVTNVRPEADEVTIKVDEANNTRLRMTLNSIARIVSDEADGEQATK